MTLLNIDKTVNTIILTGSSLSAFLEAKFESMVDLLYQITLKFDKLTSITIIWDGEISNSYEFEDIDLYNDKSDIYAIRKDLMKTMLNKMKSFYDDSYLKILIKSNIKSFDMMWNTKNGF